jgi:hypothetical protein
MTDGDRRIIDLFVSMLGGLRVDVHGPTSDNHRGYLNSLANLCLEVEVIAAPGNTPEEILLHRVARLTGDLITTLAQAGANTIVREWIAARVELLQLRLSKPLI